MSHSTMFSASTTRSGAIREGAPLSSSHNHMETNVTLLDVLVPRSKELKLVIGTKMNGNDFSNNINNKIYLV